MHLLRKTTMALLSLLLLISCFSDLSWAAEAKKISVEVTSNYTTLVPGKSVLVSVKISNLPSESKGPRSAMVVLSYDENVFTTEGNIRFDDDLGKYIWRDDTFFIPSKAYETADYKIENPYPLDLNPNDGRREVVLSILNQNNKTIGSTANEAFVSFYLTVKGEIKTQGTSINILSDETRLEGVSGTAILDYDTTSARLFVGVPKKIEIVRGILPPTSEPYKLSLNSGLELNALAVFDNGDTAYVTELSSWKTTDSGVITTPAQGNIQAVGLGSASVIATFGSVTGKHEVTVYPANAPELIEEQIAYVIVRRIPNEKSFAAATVVQVSVNGKTAKQGRLFDGTVYVPLRSVSELLEANLGYDAAQKAPMIDGKPVTHFYNFSGITYIKARDISSLFGAEIKWDKKRSTLTVKSSERKQN
ncbi:hypothetical protein AMS62_24070 [Bacillus sp. FJAT-18019]|nr:hypothetical protein AMS62_24070 [Bacillus sp. FJAT-18019]